MRASFVVPRFLTVAGELLGEPHLGACANLEPLFKLSHEHKALKEFHPIYN